MIPLKLMKKNKGKSFPSKGACAIGIDEMMPLVRERIAAGGNATIPVRGVSMRPMLKEGRDSVILSPIRVPLKAQDIVLYQRENGSYILHRIVAASETYTCIGDAQFVFEKGIAPSQMIAVVSAVRRGERILPITHPMYRLYAWLWSASRPMRRFFIRAVRKLGRMLGIKK